MYARSDQQILITGGAGFIGSNPARDFIPEHDVTVLNVLTSVIAVTFLKMLRSSKQIFEIGTRFLTLPLLLM